MIDEKTSNVKDESVMDEGFESAPDRAPEDASMMGPVHRAYLTVPFKEARKEWLHHVAHGALKAHMKVTCEQDEAKLRALKGQGWYYLHEGGFRGEGKPKAYWGHCTNTFSVDLLIAHWDRLDAEARKHGDRYHPFLLNGKGLTGAACDVFTRLCGDIDDGPDGPIPTLEQCDMVDQAIADGIPISDVILTGGMREGLDPITDQCEAGRGVHVGINHLPSADKALMERTQHAVIVYFNSDPACSDPGRRMRMGGYVAKHANDEECRHRIQSWIYADGSLPTLQEVHDRVMAACRKHGHIDTEREFEALAFCPSLRGCITTLERRIKTAQGFVEKFWNTDRSEATRHGLQRDLLQRQLLDVRNELARVRSTRKVSDRTRELAASARKPHAEYDPTPQQQVRRPASPTAGTPASSSFEPSGNLAYVDPTQEHWNLRNDVWKHKQGGVVTEGTFPNLFEQFGNKDRRLLGNILCPYCGKSERPDDATPSGFIVWSASGLSAKACCKSCGSEHWSSPKIRGPRVRKSTKKSASSDGETVNAYSSSEEGATVSPLQKLLCEYQAKAVIQKVTGREYLPDVQMNHKVIGIRAPWKMGKTEAVVRMAKEHPDLNILYVCPTQNLSESAHGRLEEFGFVLYKDQVGGELTCRRLVTCLDSVVRIAWGMKYDAVILEEAVSTLGRFNDGAMRQRADVWRRLKDLSRDCDHLLLLDADLDVETLHAAERLAGSKDVQLVNGRRKLGVTMTVFETAEDLEAARRKLSGPVFVYSNTLARAETTTEFLKAERPNERGLLVGSPTSGEADVAHLMKHPNDQVLGLGYLVGTPSMNTGVSIDARWFQHQVVFAAAGTFTTPQAVCQGIFRDRENPHRLLHVSNAKVGASEDPAYYRRRLEHETKAEIDKAMALAAEADFGCVSIFGPQAVDPDLIETRVEFYVRDAHGQNNLRKQVFAILKDAGVKQVKGPKATVALREKIREEVDAVKEGVRDSEDRAVLAAAKLDDETANRLQRKYRSTREERRAVTRYMIQCVVGHDVELTKDIVAGFARDSLRGKVFRFTGVEAFLAGLGPQYAARRLEAYNQDPTRAEDGDLRECEAIAMVLREGFGIPSLIDLTTVARPDDNQVERLKALSNDSEVASLTGLDRYAVEHPMGFLGDLLRRCGFKGRAERHRVNGKMRYSDYAISPGSSALMAMLTAHQRSLNQPHDMWLDGAVGRDDYVVEETRCP